MSSRWAGCLRKAAISASQVDRGSPIVVPTPDGGKLWSSEQLGGRDSYGHTRVEPSLEWVRPHRPLRMLRRCCSPGFVAQSAVQALGEKQEQQQDAGTARLQERVGPAHSHSSRVQLKEEQEGLAALPTRGGKARFSFAVCLVFRTERPGWV